MNLLAHVQRRGQNLRCPSGAAKPEPTQQRQVEEEEVKIRHFLQQEGQEGRAEACAGACVGRQKFLEMHDSAVLGLHLSRLNEPLN